MTARRLALLTLLPGLLAFAPAPFPRATRSAPDLTGTWEFVRWEQDGKERNSDVTGWRAEAAGDRFDAVSNDGKERRGYEMHLYPKTNPPALAGASVSAPAVKYYGSYRVRGDVLTIVLAQGGTFAGRPQDFDAKVQHRLVLRRVKK